MCSAGPELHAAEADDRTARARIRDAALTRISAPGSTRVTLRAIAADAGVSPALVVHHFGSLAGLRQACDEHVLRLIRAQVREISAGRAPTAADYRAAIQEAGPILGYLSRALLDDSPAAAALFDQIVDIGVDYLRAGVDQGWARPSSDPPARAALLATFELGVLVLGRHLSRALGVDVTTPEGTERWTKVALEIYTHGLLTDDRFLTALTGDGPPDQKDNAT